VSEVPFVYRYQTALREARNLTTSEKCVLAMMLTYADPDGTNVFPGDERLAADCSLSVRQMQRCRESARKKRWLRVTKRGGGNGQAGVPSKYALSIPGELTRHQ
jgi:Helix-turn-helix domain